MGQTLSHGVYLPNEGERNCYAGLASNWQILNTAVGAIAEKAPLVHTHTKSDIDVYFYEKIYDDGHLGTFTKSAEFAYKLGWDIENNYISIEDTQQSDINGWTYPKELCPMKTEEDKLKDQYRLEIQQLKKQLSDSDYKAIKYAEGQISESEYASVRELRQGYRDRINELEALL